MKSVLVLASCAFLIGINAYAGDGPGAACKDAARAAARQEAINFVKREGLDGKKVTVIQAEFSAIYVQTISEGRQGTFTDKILVDFSTPGGTSGTMPFEVDGQQLGDQCNILGVN